MKPDQIYQELKHLADRLGVVVAEKKLSSEHPRVKSGLCRIRGQYVVILDKQLPVYRKSTILADCLNGMPHETLYVIPAVREFLSRHQKGEEAVKSQFSDLPPGTDGLSD